MRIQNRGGMLNGAMVGRRMNYLISPDLLDGSRSRSGPSSFDLMNQPLETIDDIDNNFQDHEDEPELSTEGIPNEKPEIENEKKINIDVIPGPPPSIPGIKW